MQKNKIKMKNMLLNKKISIIFFVFCAESVASEIDPFDRTPSALMASLPELSNSSNGSDAGDGSQSSVPSPTPRQRELCAMQEQLKKDAEGLRIKIAEVERVAPFYQDAIKSLQRDCAILENLVYKQKVWRFVCGSAVSGAAAVSIKAVMEQVGTRGHFGPSGVRAHITVDTKALLTVGAFLGIGLWYYNSVKEKERIATLSMQNAIDKIPFSELGKSAEIFRSVSPLSSISQDESYIDPAEGEACMKELREGYLLLRKEFDTMRQEYHSDMRVIKSILERKQVHISEDQRDSLLKFEEEHFYEIPQPVSRDRGRKVSV